LGNGPSGPNGDELANGPSGPSGDEMGRVFERLAEENAALAVISRVINSSTDAGEAYEMVAAQMSRLVPFDRLIISHLDVADDMVTTVFVSGVPVRGRVRGTVMPADVTLTGRAVTNQSGATNDALEIADLDEAMKSYPDLVEHVRAGLHSLMAVPLVAKGRIAGSLILASRSTSVYGQVQFLLTERVAAQIAGYMQMNTLLRQLRAAEERYQGLFDDAPVGYFELNMQGHITRANRTQLDMFLYAEDEMVGRPMWNFSADPVVDELAIKSFLGSSGGDGESFEIAAVRKDETTFFARFSGLVLRGDNGETIGMRVAMRDITRLRQLEGQLARSQRMDALGKFAGGIAHDFSNMVTSMVLHVDSALSTASTDTMSTESSLRQIQWAADRASDLTRKLMAFSKRQKDSDELEGKANDLLASAGYPCG
jgi:PAS domain S-box-containing protein